MRTVRPLFVLQVLKPDNTTYQSSFNMPWDRDVVFQRRPASEVNLTWGARSMTFNDAVCGVLYPNHWYTYVDSSTPAMEADINGRPETSPPSTGYDLMPVVLLALLFGAVVGSVIARMSSRRRRAAAHAGGAMRHVQLVEEYDMRPLEQLSRRSALDAN